MGAIIVLHKRVVVGPTTLEAFKTLFHFRYQCVKIPRQQFKPFALLRKDRFPMSDQALASGLTLVVERAGDEAIVECRGRLVAGVNDRLQLEVSRLIPGSRRILLDFTDVSHMDSTGLGTLVRLYVSAKSAGCVLQLINIGKPIRQLLGITHLLSVFEVIGNNHIRCG
jgi:anti-sigma B factor antagonist